MSRRPEELPTVPGHRLLDARSSVPETLRLLDEQDREVEALRDPLREWMRAVGRERRDRVRQGTFEGSLWIGPKDEAVGLADWSLPAEAGRRVHLYLSPGYRAPASIGAFLRDLDTQARLLGVAEPVPGVEAVVLAGVLPSLGFSRVLRIDMVYPTDRPLPPMGPWTGPGLVRPLTLSDEPAIASLLERAYRDNPVDRTLFVRFLDAREDARVSAEELLHGGVGAWRADASFGVWVDGALVAATLVNILEGTLISEVMVDPSHRRRGYARRLLAESLTAARAHDLGRPRLVVTEGNERARPLYRSVGFVELPESEGGIWLRPWDPSAGA